MIKVTPIYHLLNGHNCSQKIFFSSFIWQKMMRMNTLVILSFHYSLMLKWCNLTATSFSPRERFRKKPNMNSALMVNASLTMIPMITITMVTVTTVITKITKITKISMIIALPSCFLHFFSPTYIRQHFRESRCELKQHLQKLSSLVLDVQNFRIFDHFSAIWLWIVPLCSGGLFLDE